MNGLERVECCAYGEGSGYKSSLPRILTSRMHFGCVFAVYSYSLKPPLSINDTRRLRIAYRTILDHLNQIL